MPPCLGGKSLVTMSVRSMAPISVAALAGGLRLRARGAVEAVRVPGRAHRDLLHAVRTRRGIDDVPASDVDRDVADAVIEHEVAWLNRGRGDVRQRGPLLIGVARDRDARRRPRRLHETRTVVAGAARAGAAVDVGAAKRAVGELDSGVRLGAGGTGVGARRGAAAAAETVGDHGLLLLSGQRVQRVLLALEQLLDGVLRLRPLAEQLLDAELGALLLFLHGAELLGDGEELLSLHVPRAGELRDDRRVLEYLRGVVRGKQSGQRRLRRVHVGRVGDL